MASLEEKEKAFLEMQEITGVARKEMFELRELLTQMDTLSKKEINEKMKPYNKSGKALARRMKELQKILDDETES